MVVARVHVVMMMVLADQQVMIMGVGTARSRTVGLGRAAARGMIVVLEIVLTMDLGTVDGTTASDTDDFSKALMAATNVRTRHRKKRRWREKKGRL